jgi:hypothetical protein
MEQVRAQNPSDTALFVLVQPFIGSLSGKIFFRATVLSHSAFVQMYTDASKSKDGQFVIQGFRTIWPSKLFTQVTLEAQKSYSSTSSSSGKLVFNINKDPKVIDNVEKAATTDAPGASQAGELNDYIGPGGDTEKLNQVGQGSRLTGPGAQASRQSQEPDFDPSVTGRVKH